MQASANSDKGCILDFADGAYEPKCELLRAKSQILHREGGAPAHIPYVKATPPMEGLNSAKGVWALELLDRKTSGPVLWRSPIRLRHVASGKYLSVDSSKPATPSTESFEYRNSSGRKVEPHKETESYRSNWSGTMFNAGLVPVADASIQAGKLGSAASMVFYLVPSEDVSDSDALANNTSTILIEHRPPQKVEGPLVHKKSFSDWRAPSVLYLVVSIDELKPQLEGAPQLAKRIDESEANEGETSTADGSVEKPQLGPPQLAEVDENMQMKIILLKRNKRRWLSKGHRWLASRRFSNSVS